MLDVLDVLDAAHPGGPWRLVGSSMGGWLAARWAELHPEKVDRLLLLCPAFGLIERWAQKLGPQILAGWESAGTIEIPDASGQRIRMGWNFVADARRHPLVPEPRQPTVIVHGTADTMVPIVSSEAWIAAHPGNALHVVDDDHGLAATIPTIHALVDAFLREPELVPPEHAVRRVASA
jgi:pimeloyl-ACP methyl ester carboxylesterase